MNSKNASSDSGVGSGTASGSIPRTVSERRTNARADALSGANSTTVLRSRSAAGMSGSRGMNASTRVERVAAKRSIIARSNNAWEVSWVERATNATGTTEPELYTGVFTVTTRPPRNADEIANNPLGLLISDFSWSRER